MTKRMNGYVLLLNNEADACPLPSNLSATFNARLSQWMQDNSMTGDMIRMEAAEGAPRLHIVCTEDLARRISESFAGSVASVRMDRENVITLPDPLPRKTRRPGFEAA